MCQTQLWLFAYNDLAQSWVLFVSHKLQVWRQALHRIQDQVVAVTIDTVVAELQE